MHELSGLKIAKQEQGPQLPCSTDTLGLSGVWLLENLNPIKNGGGSKFGQICNFGSEYARDLILVSIPRFLGMGNRLGPFSDTSD